MTLLIKLGAIAKVWALRVVNEKAVVIDLGTTSPAVAAMEGGKPTIVSLSRKRMISSLIFGGRG